MASVEMIEEEAATGKVKEVYDDIKESLGIDFVPNMYKAMARHPAYLEASWNKISAVMGEQHELDASRTTTAGPAPGSPNILAATFSDSTSW